MLLQAHNYVYHGLQSSSYPQVLYSATLLPQ